MSSRFTIGPIAIQGSSNTQWTETTRKYYGVFPFNNYDLGPLPCPILICSIASVFVHLFDISYSSNFLNL